VIRRPKCRKGVSEIGNVPNAGLSIVPYIAAIWIVLAKNTAYLPNKPDNYKSGVFLVEKR
jgi:hypothetical protein